MNFELLAAEFVLTGFASEALAELATTALLEGATAPSFAVLAGSAAGEAPADLRDLFVSALRESGVQLPNRVEAAHQLKFDFAREVSEGRLAAPRGALQIIRVFGMVRDELPTSAGYVGDEFGIASLYGIYDDYENLTTADDPRRASVVAALRAACQEIVGSRARTI